MIVENAKKNSATAINATPICPIPSSNAFCVTLIPFSPSIWFAPVAIITSALIVRTTNVSINTPTIATRPWSHGWLTFAIA